MSGAWVSRATLQAADGAPMPTKQTSSLPSARAAAMVIISSGVKSAMTQPLHAAGEDFGAHVHDIGLHPGLKTLAIRGDLVPLEIAPVVALVVAVCVARMRSSGHHRDRRYRPVRQDAGVGVDARKILDHLFDGDHRALRGENG